MVVGTVDTLRFTCQLQFVCPDVCLQAREPWSGGLKRRRRTLPISSEHRRDRGPSKQRHGVGSRIVQLAVLAALATRPRGADDEDVACGGGSLGLIAARNVHWLEYALASLDASSRGVLQMDDWNCYLPK